MPQGWYPLNTHDLIWNHICKIWTFSKVFAHLFDEQLFTGMHWEKNRDPQHKRSAKIHKRAKKLYFNHGRPL